MIVPGSLNAAVLGASRSARIVATDNAANASPQTNYTFTGRAIGDAAAGRKVIVGVALSAQGFHVSSLTVGDIAASMVVRERYPDTGASDIVEIWIADVPTGTTATIQINGGGVQDDCGIGLWALYDAAGTASATATSENQDPASASLAVPAHVVAAGITIIRSDTDRTFTWSGLTEDFDGVIESASSSFTRASGKVGGTITCTPSGAGLRNPVMVLASWGPL